MKNSEISKSLEVIKAIGIGALAGVALGFIKILVIPSAGHTLENMNFFMNQLPLFALMGGLIGLLAGRASNRY